MECHHPNKQRHSKDKTAKPVEQAACASYMHHRRIVFLLTTKPASASGDVYDRLKPPIHYSPRNH